MWKAQATNLSDALNQAVLNVRYSLMGYWQLAHKLTILGENSMMGSGGTPPGSLFNFSGVLEVQESMNLRPTTAAVQTVVQPYGVGQGQGANSAKSWDRRPSIGKACAANTECSLIDGLGDGAEPPCHIVCSPETHMCPGGGEGAEVRHGAQCTQDTGTTGECCSGTCQSPADDCLVCDGDDSVTDE